MYDYRKEIKEDIKNYINDNNINIDEISRDELEEELWTEDSVTGNASGSYTFNRSQAEDYVKDNMDLCCEVLEVFGELRELGNKIADGEWEWLDVTIRCYLLGECVEEAINELCADNE